MYCPDLHYWIALEELRQSDVTDKEFIAQVTVLFAQAKARTHVEKWAS